MMSARVILAELSGLCGLMVLCGSLRAEQPQPSRLPAPAVLAVSADEVKPVPSSEQAGTPAGNPNAAAKVYSPETLAHLVQQLDAPTFTDRDAAQKELVRAGKGALPAVQKGAQGDNLEVSLRCLTVIEHLARAEDAATRTAALEALKQLAESNRPVIAQRAKALVAPPPEVQQANGFGGNAVILNVNGIRINRIAAGVQNLRMSVKNINGNTEIEVEENGVKTEIRHTSEKDIVIKLTEPPAGDRKEPKTTEYKAKDLAELKDKHPAGFKLWEKYAQNQKMVGGIGGGIQIQAQAVPQLRIQPAVPQLLPAVPAQPVPAQPAPAQRVPAQPAPQEAPVDRVEPAPRVLKKSADLADLSQQLQQTQADLQRTAQKLEALQKDKAVTPESLLKLSHELHDATLKLHELRAQLLRESILRKASPAPVEPPRP